MEWRDGYSTEWCVFAVNADTWDDERRIDGIMEVSISRDGTDDVPLLETGTMKADSADPFDWSWCRICMRADQDGFERVPMATLLFEQGSTHTQFQAPTCELRGRSVLQPAADMRLAHGYYAPSGCDGAEFAANLLRECTPAPVNVEGSFSLVDDVVFDLGSTYLAAAWSVLQAADWCMQIDGDGTINIREKPKEPSLELDKAHAGLLIPGIDRTLDLTDIPNRYIAIQDGKSAIATNEDPNLLASYQRRGRWVDEVDTAPVPVDGEDLLAYAQRKLAEKSTVLREFSYIREYWPGVVPYSLVRATLPGHGIEGELRVMSQTLECGKGVKVSEKAGQEVRV